ncbi:cation:proton antiporter [Bacteroidota bacterium]
MANNFDILIFIASFIIIALASKQIGQILNKATLPLISGFLFTGIIAGPYMLNLISADAIEKLGFVDEISLSFIAFAAGSELYIEDLRSRLKSIKWVTIGLVLSTFTIGSITIILLSDMIPFMKDMPVVGKIAVAILGGSILVARSPSSAIAVVKELRAKGPFTQTVLGVTVISDVVVIALFAANTSIADALLSGLGFDISFIVLLFVELILSVLLGYILGQLLKLILSIRIDSNFKVLLILAAGYSIYVLSDQLRHFTQEMFSFEILMEPLLICMIGGFLVTNYSKYRMEFYKVLHDVGPLIYIAFFTLTGASLSLDILAKTWQIALILFFVRCGSIFIGSFAGGVIAKDPMEYNRISWMSYVTQAGVGLGLAKAVVVVFPGWGNEFATIIISIIVLNQIIGPILFKRAINLVGESHSFAESSGFEVPRSAVIFGMEGQSVALARLLNSHGWSVKIASLKATEEDVKNSDVKICPIGGLSMEILEKINVGEAETIVTMLSDDENFNICEIAYEHFGMENMIVRLNDRSNFNRFHELGALIVDPTTAIVSLLDHFVRSPSAASLLLGMEKGQDVIEVEVRDPDLNGIALRDLRLPLDIIVLSINRRGHMLISHGYTRIELGDWVSLCGSTESLEEVALKFDVNREDALVHIVEKVSAKQFSTPSFEKDVKKIIREKTIAPKSNFEKLLNESFVLDIDHCIEIEELFKVIAETMSARLEINTPDLLQLLINREKESTTVINRELAIPHIIIDGENKSCILLCRCKKGIRFSESAPKVHAVFVLAGTIDQKNFHIKTLSTIARIVQDQHFENKWIRARNKSLLPKILIHSHRKRTE